MAPERRPPSRRRGRASRSRARRASRAPRFGTCEQPRGSRRPDERGRARRRRRIGRGRRAGGPRVGAEEREGFVGARSRSVGRARSSLVERHERVAPTRGERAGAGKGERASPRGVPGGARARAPNTKSKKRGIEGIYDLARARSARIVRAGTSARGLPRERVSARREGRGIARSRARARSRAPARALSRRARGEEEGYAGRGAGWAMWRCGDVARARGRGARAAARARRLSGRERSLRSPRLGAGPRDFLQVGGKRGRHIDTSRYHYVCLRLRFHSNSFRCSVHLKRVARLLRAGGVACAQKGCLAICTLRYT